jgi:hypothetical protein
MNKNLALTITIGLLAVADTYLTATVLPVPVWVTFIAWASYFVLGGGTNGLVRSIASNITGIAIGSGTLLFVTIASTHTLTAALWVGFGSAMMIQASRLGLLSVAPAIVFGFASTVGTSVATGHAIITTDIHNPLLVAVTAMVLGNLFGYLSEISADFMVNESKDPGSVSAVS